MSTQTQQAREQLEQILANPDYQQPTEQDNFSGLNELKSFAQSAFGGVDWLVYLVVGVVVLVGIVLAIWLYFRKRSSWQALMQYRPQSQSSQDPDLVAHMDALAEQGEYRKALQQCYQYLLQSLTNQAFVLKNTQTNGEHRQYIQSKHSQTAMEFVKLSTRFDHIWYGQELLTKQHFELFREQVFLLLKEELFDESD